MSLRIPGYMVTLFKSMSYIEEFPEIEIKTNININNIVIRYMSK